MIIPRITSLKKLSQKSYLLALGGKVAMIKTNKISNLDKNTLK